MTVIDLKSLLDSGHFNLKNIKEMADEYWTDSLFANNGFSPATRPEKVCQTISQKLQGSKVFMRIRYVDKETEQNLVFLTNCFTLPAITIAQLYKCRWRVELFFKWIKQHLRIKVFFGTTENAVKTQIWIAISVYVLVAIIKKLLNLELNLYTILQILSVTLFEKVSILQVLMEAGYKTDDTDFCNQLMLFDL